MKPEFFSIDCAGYLDFFLSYNPEFNWFFCRNIEVHRVVDWIEIKRHNLNKNSTSSGVSSLGVPGGAVGDAIGTPRFWQVS